MRHFAAGNNGARAVYHQMLRAKRKHVLASPAVRVSTSLDFGQLRLVEEALDRIRSGDFGVCLACAQPIPPIRLLALPWARYCVPCQEAIGGILEDEVL